MKSALSIDGVDFFVWRTNMKDDDIAPYVIGIAEEWAFSNGRGTGTFWKKLGGVDER